MTFPLIMYSFYEIEFYLKTTGLKMAGGSWLRGWRVWLTFGVRKMIEWQKNDSS